MPTEIITITGPRIIIKGSLSRHEIVKTVVNQFIETEHSQKGFGVKFQYPVETLPNGMLMIGRPGHKKNFDFKVLVESTFGLGAGLHDDIVEDFCQKVISQDREALFSALSEIYHCSENDVDIILSRNSSLRGVIAGTAQTEVLLKVLKWFFIMEDIIYWDNEGRAFLYNYLNYVARETDKDRLERAKQEVKVRPTNLRKYMKQFGLEWTVCKG